MGLAIMIVLGAYGCCEDGGVGVMLSWCCDFFVFEAWLVMRMPSGGVVEDAGAKSTSG